MRSLQEETARLNEARALVKARFPRFGVNKEREITRLLCEISRRDGVPPAGVLRGIDTRRFAPVKEHLARLRYPHASPAERARAVLPEIDFALSPAGGTPGTARFSPRRILVEQSVRDSALARRFRRAFPGAGLVEIESLKEHLANRGDICPPGYGARRDTVFIVRERHDFFKNCPCTRGAMPCGYHILNLGFGCAFDCAYCFLQGYANSPGIILPANHEDFFDRFERFAASPAARRWRRQGRIRIGTGEFSDSLVLDRLTEYSPPLVDFFSRHPETLFELKTKSDAIGNLLKVRHAGNIVVGWSLNPQAIIDAHEPLTAPLARRLGAAASAADAGYPVAFHFDPVIHFEGWEASYGGVVDALFEAVKPVRIAWISVGTLRFAPETSRAIERRHPGSALLDGELLPGFDGKLRYPRAVRLRIYRGITRMLLARAKNVPLYLCMEEAAMWSDLSLPFPFS